MTGEPPPPPREGSPPDEPRPPAPPPGGWQPPRPGPAPSRDQPAPPDAYQPAPPAPPQPPPPAGYGPVPAAPPLAAARLAGFWRRFFAYLIDVILIGLVSAAISSVIAAIVRASATDTAGLSTREGLLGLIVGLLYFGYFWSQRGQSLGYMALGMRLTRSDDTPVSFGLAMLRYLLIYLSFALCLIPALISAIMIATGTRRQAIHDLIVNTLVVRT